MACSWAIGMVNSRVAVGVGVGVVKNVVKDAVDQVVHCGYTWQVEFEVQQ